MAQFQAPTNADNTQVMIAAIFTALSREMLSGDVMYLAFTNAARLAIEAGAPEDEVEEFMTRVAKIMQEGRSRNPLSGIM